MEKIAIHEDKNSERVVKFIDLEEFTDEFQREYNKGFVHGVYYDEYGQLVASMNWGDGELTDILK